MKSVLIVDDNPLIRSALRTFLQRRAACRVCAEAVDGVDAIHKAREQKPDVVLLDLSMPNLSGAGAAAIIRKTVPNARIIVFTLYSGALGTRLAKTLGIDVIVDKSAGANGLTEALKKMFPVCP